MQIRFHRQETDYTCGAAAMRMALEACGIRKSEKELARLLGTNKVRGTWHRKLPELAEKLRLDYIVKKNSSLAELKKAQKNGYVVIICYFYPPEKVDHYSVLKNIGSKSIYFWDPWFGPKHKYGIRYFLKVWHSDPRFERKKRWFFAVRKAKNIQ